MSKIYALCSNPKVDYLTDGKLYEVMQEELNGRFMAKIDGYNRWWFTWGGEASAKWTRVEQQDPPLWALDKAAKLAGYSCFQATKNKNNRTAIASTRAHAATIAKYEKEPVDPVLVKARELLNDELFRNEFGLTKVTKLQAIDAIKAALRLPAMGGDQ